jgi:hypothetical protein
MSEKEKINYKIPADYSTYDICVCAAKCKTPCGRKGKPVEPMFSFSDFSDTCVSFEPEDENTPLDYREELRVELAKKFK